MFWIPRPQYTIREICDLIHPDHVVSCESNLSSAWALLPRYSATDRSVDCVTIWHIFSN